MKLLMITGLGSAKDLASGKKGAFYNTLEEFHKYWDRIDIIAPHIENLKIENSLKIENCKLKIFDNVFVHISPWPLIFYPLWFLKKGLEIYKEQNFDLMTVHEFPPFYNGIGARLLWRKIHVPYVLEIHHISGYPKAADLKEKIYAKSILWKLYWKFFGSKAKAVRVVNQKQVSEFLVKAGVPEKKIVYIPSIYLDLEVFKPLPAEGGSPPKDGQAASGGDKKYDIVFAARLEKNKGIFELLRAISNVKIQIPNIKLLIIGSGPLKQELVKFIEQNGLKNNVFFSGWLATSDDVARAYSSAKIFVNPSYNEGGPRVVLEAMACGLPIITTRVGLMPDIIKDNENGLFTDWNAEDMANKISRLLKDVEFQRKFSKIGLELVKQFERKEAIKNYAEQLQKLADPSHYADLRT